MEEKMDAVMDGCIAASLAAIDKDGCLHIGLHGGVEEILLCVARVLIDLSKHNDIPLEEIGKMLNTSANILQEGEDKHE